MPETALIHPKSNHCRGLLEKFFKINRQRIMRTQACLTPAQCDFLEVLPLLFHVNHKALPGYVSDNTPAGIAQYSPTYATSKAAAKHFPTANIERRAIFQTNIHALYCMGSSGTIAYTNKSDFDIWLIHSPMLSVQEREELAEKAALIEKWAMELRLEVHFFIFDTDTFKQGQSKSLSSENSGTTQYHLLLDEFYRSSLLIAGRYPVWWLVPPEQEHEYEVYINSLIDAGAIDNDDFVDFGNAAEICADEFFGAALWQLYKGIESPYKSVQKLLLMEVYASEYPDIALLSSLYKRAIHDGIKDFAELDPYIMMYKKVEAYLMRHHDQQRLDLFRKCFYFKINLRMGQTPKRKPQNWRRELMEGMVNDWDWDLDKLNLLDSRDNWRIENVITERHALVNVFSASYRFLSDFAREHAEVSRVSQGELNLLGRKLYAAFERKAGKIEILNKGIAPDLLEHEISIYHQLYNGDQDRWMMFRGRIDPENLWSKTPLKRASSIIELLTWGYFNNIINLNTAVSLHTQDRNLSAKEIKDILKALGEHFPGGNISQTGFNDLSHPARANIAGLFINIGLKTGLRVETRDRHLTSSRIDPLSYGGFHENLAKTFDMLIMTSWEEVLIYHYEGADGLLQCISDYLRWAPLQKHLPPVQVKGFNFSSKYSQTIIQRLQNLFTSIINAYYANPHAEQTRYVLLVEDTTYVTEYHEGNLKYHKTKSLPELTELLSEPRPKYSPVVFDKHSIWDMPLPDIYNLNQPDKIQMFFSIGNKEAEIYIIDERGTLFSQRTAFHDSQSLINHFHLFFNSITKRRNILLDENSMPMEEVAVEFYLLSKNKNRTYTIKPIDFNFDPEPKNFLNIQVLGSLYDNSHTSITIYCQEFEFSSLEFEDRIFSAVASHILQLRSDGQPYPIYITDIDLSRSLFFESDVHHLQTIHYLKYKKEIEDKLNYALQKRIAQGFPGS